MRALLTKIDICFAPLVLSKRASKRHSLETPHRMIKYRCGNNEFWQTFVNDGIENKNRDVAFVQIRKWIELVPCCKVWIEFESRAKLNCNWINQSIDLRFFALVFRLVSSAALANSIRTQKQWSVYIWLLLAVKLLLLLVSNQFSMPLIKRSKNDNDGSACIGRYDMAHTTHCCINLNEY